MDEMCPFTGGASTHGKILKGRVLATKVCRGNLKEAWCATDTMKRRGIEPDNCTVSVMLKPLKRHWCRFEATCDLAMADPLSLEVIQDEVLFLQH